MAVETQIAARQVCDLLSGLVGREVSADGVVAAPKIDVAPAYIATYVDETGKVIALCRCDIAGSASLGAALSMLPAGRVDDCIKASVLDEMVFENFWEVCNVLVRVFNSPHQPSLTLKTINALPLAADSGVDLTATPANRVDIGLTVQGYREGLLSLLRL